MIWHRWLKIDDWLIHLVPQFRIVREEIGDQLWQATSGMNDPLGKTILSKDEWSTESLAPIIAVH
jgi:hypothetical protein